MASNIKIKRSETSGNPSTLGAGELAYSALADNGSNGGDRLYIGSGTETAGNAVNHVVIGGKYFTDMITAATNVNTASTLVKRDASGNFAANAITAALLGNATTASTLIVGRSIGITGDITYISPSFNGSDNVTAAATLATVNANIGTWNNVTVNAKGLVTAGSNTAYLTANDTITVSGDATGSGTTAITLTLADTAVTAGSYGSSTAIPVFTVDAKGRLTAVSTAAISTSFNVYGNSGVTAVGGGGSFEIAGGTGVTTNASGGPRLTINIGQAVAPTDNVTFNNVTVNGTLSSNDITSTNISIDGNATITGNLTVSGTTTTVNSTAVAITDINLTLAKDATTAAEANGAGLTVAGSGATLTYTSSNDRWNLNKDLVVGTVYAALSGNASTASAWATARNLSLTGDATATLTSVDGSAAVSAALTLATVNSNVGSFGSGTEIPLITVNAKGLVTAVATTAIATATATVLGLAKFSSSDFLVTSGLVTIDTVDGGIY